jgi:hypothetical protein
MNKPENFRIDQLNDNGKQVALKKYYFQGQQLLGIQHTRST